MNRRSIYAGYHEFTFLVDPLIIDCKEVTSCLVWSIVCLLVDQTWVVHHCLQVILNLLPYVNRRGPNIKIIIQRNTCRYVFLWIIIFGPPRLYIYIHIFIYICSIKYSLYINYGSRSIKFHLFLFGCQSRNADLHEAMIWKRCLHYYNCL